MSVEDRQLGHLGSPSLGSACIFTIARLNESSEAPEPRRSYDAPVRRARAAQTRDRIALAARALFAERGWAGTRLRDVADRAGVAEPTVYATYGSKARLAGALIESLEDEVDLAASYDRLAELEGDPAAQLAELVAFDRRLFETGRDLLTLLREAAPAHPELDAAYAEKRGNANAARAELFGRWPAATFRRGVDAADATVSFAALCNLDVYLVLTDEQGLSPAATERWWLASLTRLIMRD